MKTPLNQFCQRIAAYFLQHLQDEMGKKTVDTQVFDKKTARQINSEIIDSLKQEFTGAEEVTLEFHLFRRWFELNQFPMAYEDFCTEAYNLIFWERIRDLKTWSEASNALFEKLVVDVFSKFDYRREGFSVSNFLTFENNMRELFRTVLKELQLDAGDEEQVWQTIYAQSAHYQNIVNQFFENILKEAFAESERLLNNILPESISSELKENEKVKPVHLDAVTVLFTDFKGFTMASEKMTPEQLISELDECFSIFDEIIERHNLEKIKTIGDAFMCAGGLPAANHTHVYDVALAALAMREEINKLARMKAEAGNSYWEVRIGFHSGPIVAGVIGKKKFSYDIWGDTVNTASRMESSGEAGRVNTSAFCAEKLRPFFQLSERGEIAAKNKGALEMFFVERLKKQYSDDEDGLVPNARFKKIMEALKEGKKIKIIPKNESQDKNDT